MDFLAGFLLVHAQKVEDNFRNQTVKKHAMAN